MLLSIVSLISISPLLLLLGFNTLFFLQGRQKYRVAGKPNDDVLKACRELGWQ